MRTAKLTALAIALLCAVGLAGCNKAKEDKIETVRMYVSAETGTCTPWGSDGPVECMLVMEEGADTYTNLVFGGISGSTYEKGHEYVLQVEKRTLADPPADSGNVKYKLLEILEDKPVM